MPSALVSRISVASLRLRYHRDRNGIEVAALLDDVVEDGVMNSRMIFLLPFLCRRTQPFSRREPASGESPTTKRKASARRSVEPFAVRGNSASM